jgi:ankyrin repeat protein
VLQIERAFLMPACRGSFLALMALWPSGCASNPGSPLAEAARRGDDQQVGSMLSQGANPDERDSLGRTALMNAAGAPGRTLLIDKSGRSSFSELPGQVDLPILRLLIDRGAALDLVDSSGYTALFFAVYSGSSEAVATLLAAGADPNAGQGIGPLLMAANRDDLEAVKLLLAEGADPGDTDEHGQTPLMTAAYGGNVPILRELLSAGASIDATDKNGNTALSNAAHQGKLEAARFLIESGASLDLRSIKGETPLSIAVQRKHDEVAALLRAAGAHE